jgi:hypothetical protein
MRSIYFVSLIYSSVSFILAVTCRMDRGVARSASKMQYKVLNETISCVHHLKTDLSEQQAERHLGTTSRTASRNDKQNGISERQAERHLGTHNSSILVTDGLLQRPLWVPLLSTKNKKKWLQWSRFHQHWTTEEWKHRLEHDREFSLLEWPGQSPDGTGCWLHECTAVQSTATVWCRHISMVQQPCGTLPTRCRMPEEFGMFWRQREVRPSTRYVYLINFLVSFLFSRFPQQTFKNEVPGSFPTFVRSQINFEGFVGQSKKGPRKQKTEKIVLNFPVGCLYSFPVSECFLSLAG